MIRAIRLAQKQAFKGVWTFYVGSETRKGVEYIVKYVRRKRVQRKWYCTCPAFIHQAAPLGHVCKHIQPLSRLVREFGIRKVAKQMQQQEGRVQ